MKNRTELEPDAVRVAALADTHLTLKVVRELLVETAERNFAWVAPGVVGRRVGVEFRAPPLEPGDPRSSERIARYTRLFAKDLTHLKGLVSAPVVTPPMGALGLWEVAVEVY